MPLALHQPVFNLSRGALGRLLGCSHMRSCIGLRRGLRHGLRQPGNSLHCLTRNATWLTHGCTRAGHGLHGRLLRRHHASQRGNRRRLDGPWRIIRGQQHIAHAGSGCIHIGARDVQHHRAARGLSRSVATGQAPIGRRGLCHRHAATVVVVHPVIGILGRSPLILDARRLARVNRRLARLEQAAPKGFHARGQGQLAGLLGVGLVGRGVHCIHHQ